MIETNYEWMQLSWQPYSGLLFSCLLSKMIMDGRLFDLKKCRNEMEFFFTDHKTPTFTIIENIECFQRFLNVH